MGIMWLFSTLADDNQATTPATYARAKRHADCNLIERAVSRVCLWMGLISHLE